MTMRLTGFAERLNRAAGLAGLSLKQLAARHGHEAARTAARRMKTAGEIPRFSAAASMAAN